MVCVGLLAACRNEPAPQAPLTRVKAVTTEIVDFHAVDDAHRRGRGRGPAPTSSFRITGKISERIANVGDHVVDGRSVLAKLDPDEQQEEVVSAKASVASAEALVRQTTGRLRPPEGACEPRQHHATRP